MRGVFSKKGNKYYAYVSINGNKKWIKGSGSDTKKKAEEKLNQTVSEIQKGTYCEIRKIRFRDFAKEWIETYARMRTKPSTLKSYQNIIDKQLVPRFGDYYLHQMSASMMQRLVTERLSEGKVKRVRFHDLRHTNASLRIAEGQNPKYIQKQMGHASIQTTFDRYGHLLKKADPDQAKKLDDILGLER